VIAHGFEGRKSDSPSTSIIATSEWASLASISFNFMYEGFLKSIIGFQSVGTGTDR